MSRYISNIRRGVWLLGWMTLVLMYLFSLQNNLYLEKWDNFVYVAQLVIDVAIISLSYGAYKKRTNRAAKIFHLVLFISLIFGVATNEIYNIISNLSQFTQEKIYEYCWPITYTAFLIIHAIAWVYLFINLRSGNSKIDRKWLTVYPYLQSSIIIALSLVAAFWVKAKQSGLSGVISIFNPVLEVMVFCIILINISRLKDNAVIWVATGFMLLIGFNFAHHFSDIMSIYYKAFNIAWFISLITIVYGLYLSSNNESKINFYNEDSIHVLTSGAFIIFANLILIIFIIAAFGLSVFQMDKLPGLENVALDLAGALVISYSITILLAKYLSWQLSLPLEKILRREHKQRTENEKKSALLELAARVAHDIRSPIAVMNMSLQVIGSELAEEKLTVMRLAIQSIREIANNLLHRYRKSETESVLPNSKYPNQSVLLWQIIEEVIALKRQEWIGSSCELSFNFSPTVKFEHIQVVPIEVKRVVSNLLNNSIEACELNAKIMIQLEDAGQNLKLMIHDNGRGIQSDDITLFLKGNSTKHEGAGMGLSGARKYMESIRGRLDITSKLGVGTSITLCFPKEGLASTFD